MRTSDVLYVSMVLFCQNVSRDEVNEKFTNFSFMLFGCWKISSRRINVNKCYYRIFVGHTFTERIENDILDVFI